jgi:leader peptidase (prepilin peptidase)/N-methyltransferase
MTPLLAGAAVLGLLVGSFLTVVVHRIPRGESLARPGSHCPHCGSAVRPWHNIPVLGWMLLRGRCAGCAAAISPSYPAVEATTAVLFIAVTARLGATPELPAYLYLAAAAVALAVIDWREHRLPDLIVLPSYLVGLVLLMAAGWLHGDWWAVGRGALAAAACAAAYLAVRTVYPGGLGLGDVKLAGLIGLFLGWLGWSPVLVGVAAGLLLGGLVGAVLLISGRAGRRTAIAFGPYMLTGALVALFWAEPLIRWYAAFLAPTT